MKEINLQKVFAVSFSTYGLINLAMFSLSGFSAIYISFIGVLCLIAGCGLWLRLDWSIWLTIPLGFLLPVIGIVTLYASISFIGFSTNKSAILLNLALIGYTVASLIQFVFLVVKRKKIAFKTLKNKEKT